MLLHTSTSSEISIQTEELAAAAPQAGKGTQKLSGSFCETKVTLTVKGLFYPDPDTPAQTSAKLLF